MILGSRHSRAGLVFFLRIVKQMADSSEHLADAVARGDLGALRAAPALDLQEAWRSSGGLQVEKGDTLLTWACRHKQAAVAQWLLDQGGEVDGTTAISSH